MTTITLQDAQATLVDLIHRLAPGEHITITENNQPVAHLIAPNQSAKRPPRPRPPITGVPKGGQYEGRLVIPDDFDEPLEELREYME
jgi:antitoxin (DNA-binding transcriptional repressor) of toxin-antitoxin stability system